MSDKIIGLSQLQEYDKQRQAHLASELKELDNAIVCTFNITEADTTISLQNLTGMTEINWGDGTIDSALSHKYTQTGKYTCVIKGVTSIGDKAFYDCSSLTSVVIGDSVESIGGYAFYYCKSLTSIMIPDSVTSIGSEAFRGCRSLTSVVIPDSVTSLGNWAFSGCRSLTSVVIPDSVTSIGEWAFSDCPSLTSIVVGSGLTTLEDHIFRRDHNLMNVVLSDSITSINTCAFTDCDSLTNITIPNSVASIDSSAFLRCTNLTQVVFKANTPYSYKSNTGEGLFDDCSALTKIYVPYGCSETYKTKWAEDSAEQSIIDLIIESDREAMMSDLSLLEEKVTSKQQIQVTYAELKNLRDNSELIPGQFYRIIDYVCTTTQENTKAMDHKFDIIVQALSNNTLSENASADYHDGDTYFKASSAPTITDMTINSEQVETILEDGDVEWLYSIYEDYPEDGEYGLREDTERSDVFVAFDFLENNNGVVVPVLFKNDMGTDEETGEPNYSIDDIDYYDAFFYVGEETIDGEVYDKWRKIEGDGSDGAEDFQWDSASKQYALTNKIVGEGLLIDATFTYSEGSQKIANLPAWELKYCLDNDTTRFAWAHNAFNAIKVYASEDDCTYVYIRYPEGDGQDGIAWAYVIESDSLDFSEISDWNNVDNNDLIYTNREMVEVDDSTIIATSGGPINYGPVVNVYTGKGVVYYMKDEYNNEAPYDFKNIMFNVEIGIQWDGFNYTFSGVDTDNQRRYDATVEGLPMGDNYNICRAVNNKIEAFMFTKVDDEPAKFWLPRNIVIEDKASGNNQGGIIQNIIFEGKSYNNVVTVVNPNHKYYNCFNNIFYKVGHVNVIGLHDKEMELDGWATYESSDYKTVIVD